MNFATPSQSGGTTGNKELKLEKKRLEEEIGVLGIEHERITEELKEIEVRTSKIKDNKAELEKSEKDKERLESIIDGLKIEIKSFEKTLFAIQREHAEKIALFNTQISDKEEELSKMAQSRRDDLGAVESRISSKEKRLEELTIVCNDTEEKVKGLENTIIALKEDIAGLEKESKEIVNLQIKKDELSKKIDELMALEISLNKKVKDAGKEKEKVEENLLNAESRYKKFVSEKDKIREDFDKEIKEEKEEIDKKDGLVSEKEEWIKEKEEALRKVKFELERHYNRKIKHIII